MKKFFKTTIYVLIIFGMFGTSLIQTHAQETCTVNDVAFSPLTTTSIRGGETTLTISSTNCLTGFYVQIKARNPKNSEILSVSTTNHIQINTTIPPRNKDLKLTFNTGEDSCYSGIDTTKYYNCNYFVVIKGTDNRILFSSEDVLNQLFETKDVVGNVKNQPGLLFANCKSTSSCQVGDKNDWKLIESNRLTNENCNVESVSLSPFEGDIEKKTVELSIQSNGCYYGFQVVFVEYDKSSSPNNTVHIDNYSPIKRIIPPENGLVEMKFLTGEDECEQDDDEYDCKIYVGIHAAASTYFPSDDYKKNTIIPFFTSRSSLDKVQETNFKNGFFMVECRGNCDGSNWKMLKTNDLGDNSRLNPENILLEKNSDDIESPCFTDGSYDPNCYELLAPIGGEGIVKTKNNREYINLENLSIGDYVNHIFRIALAILIVIAVVMIIIAGVQFMTVESIYGKTDARSKISNALIGLILALGIFVILETINKKLLEVNFTDNIETITIEDKSKYDSSQIVKAQKINEVGYDTAKNKQLSSNEQNYKLAYEVAGSLDIPDCVAKVILDRESNGGASAIGYDANVTADGIWSREAFVYSGIKYSGEKFTPSTNLIKDKNFINDDKTVAKDKDGLGLDWRFSHGIGLTQTTVFPKRYVGEFGWSSKSYIKWIKENQQQAWNERDNYQPFRNSLGKTYTPKQLLDAKTNLEAGFGHWKGYYNKCKSVQGAFNAYATGKCDSDTTWGEAKNRTELYNKCAS